MNTQFTISSLLSECRIHEDNELEFWFLSGEYTLELIKDDLTIFNDSNIVTNMTLTGDDLLKSYKLQRTMGKIVNATRIQEMPC